MIPGNSAGADLCNKGTAKVGPWDLGVKGVIVFKG